MLVLLLLAACMIALCTRVLLAAALTHLSLCPIFHLFSSLLLLLLLLLLAAAVLLPLLLLAPPLPVLHITTGFLPMLNIDQRRVRSQ